MGYIQKFKLQVAIRTSLSILLVLISTLTAFIFSSEVMAMSTLESYLSASIVGLLLLVIATIIMVKMSVEPIPMRHMIIEI